MTLSLVIGLGVAAAPQVQAGENADGAQSIRTMVAYSQPYPSNPYGSGAPYQPAPYPNAPYPPQTYGAPQSPYPAPYAAQQPYPAAPPVYAQPAVPRRSAKFEDTCSSGDTYFVIRFAGDPNQVLRFFLKNNHKVHIELPVGSTYARNCGSSYPGQDSSFSRVNFE